MSYYCYVLEINTFFSLLFFNIIDIKFLFLQQQQKILLISIKLLHFKIFYKYTRLKRLLSFCSGDPKLSVHKEIHKNVPNFYYCNHGI